MGTFCAGLLVVLMVVAVQGQLPRRIQVPGAIALQPNEPRPVPYRRVLQQPLQQQTLVSVPRIRRPPPNALPLPLPVRPVVEEPEEVDQGQLADEVIRQFPAQQPVQQTRQQQFLEEVEAEPAPRQPFIAPVQFRPERPLPTVLPARLPPPQPQPVRQVPVRAQPQAVRVTRPQSRPQPVAQYDEDLPRRERKRKPPIQILRKYREDNPDGSITWGYENDDGSFKEETIGIDCITRGKYGYVDPDGNRREYTYETGLKCDEPEEEIPEELIIPQGGKGKALKRPVQQQPYRIQ